MPDFLSPYPPNLSRVSESQAFSSSSTFSSGSSSGSAYFDRLSRASSGSAYLTDLTPPITPSNSNFDVEFGDRRREEAGLKCLSSPSFLAHFDALQRSTQKEDKSTGFRPLITLDEDLGYTSDSEKEEDDFDAVDALRTRLMRNKPTIKSRRALKIMEKRGKPDSSPLVDDDGVGTPVMPTKVVVTEVAEDVEDWSDDFELSMEGGIKVQIFGVEEKDIGDCRSADNLEDLSMDTSDALCEQPALESSLERYVLPSPFHNSASPNLPPKPVIRPMQLDWECSPFSLCSPSFSSSASISQILLSPFQLEAMTVTSTPAIFQSIERDGNSPFNSPAMAISSFMFSSRRIRQPLPVSLLDQSLDVATLMRLEIAASLTENNNRMNSSQARPLVGLGFDVPARQRDPELPPTPVSPIWHQSSAVAPSQSLHDASDVSSSNTCVEHEIDSMSTPSLTWSQSVAESLFQGDEVNLSFSVVQDEAPSTFFHSTLDVIMEEPEDFLASSSLDRALVGLGLGGLVESSLHSFSSISRLHQESDLVFDPPLVEPVIPTHRMSNPPEIVSSDLKNFNLSDVQTSGSKPSGDAHFMTDHLGDLSGKPRSQNSKDSLPETQTSEIEPSGALLVSNTQATINAMSGLSGKLRYPGFKISLRDVHSKIEPLGALLEADSTSGLNLDHLSVSPHYSSNTFLPQQQNDIIYQTHGIEPAAKPAALLEKHEIMYQIHRVEPAAKPAALLEKHEITYQTHRVEPPALLVQKHLQPAPPLLLASNPNLRIYVPKPLTPAGEYDRPGHAPIAFTPDNDPRSPYAKSSDYFANTVVSMDPSQAVIIGAPISCDTDPPQVLQQPCLGEETSHGASSKRSLRPSKSADGLGKGLPSDLASRAPRQRDMSSRGSADSGPKMMSTAEECQDLAKLASASSPTASSPSSDAPSPKAVGSRHFLRIRRFAKRRLSDIPEHPTPSPTLSPSPRSFSPKNGLLSPRWPDLSVFNRLRSPKLNPLRVPFSAQRTGSPLATSPNDLHSSMPPRNVDCCPLPMEETPSASKFRFPKLMSRRPQSASSLSPTEPSGSVTSPGMVEHLDIPRGLGIFRRASPNAALKIQKTSRLKPPSRKFQLLF